MKDKTYEQLKYRLEIAIEARDKLNENFHKWMTFYYVANAAILVAITGFYTAKAQGDFSRTIFILSLCGILICIFWNLSCKGYYYWSKSWMNIIIHYEKKVFEKKVFEKGDFVYGSFSEKVAKSEDPFWYATQPGNISTPKLTMLFSLLSSIGWTLHTIYCIILVFELPLCSKSLYFVPIVAVLDFYFILPLIAESRKDGDHVLI